MKWIRRILNWFSCSLSQEQIDHNKRMDFYRDLTDYLILKKIKGMK